MVTHSSQLTYGVTTLTSTSCVGQQMVSCNYHFYLSPSLLEQATLLRCNTISYVICYRWQTVMVMTKSHKCYSIYPMTVKEYLLQSISSYKETSMYLATIQMHLVSTIVHQNSYSFLNTPYQTHSQLQLKLTIKGEAIYYLINYSVEYQLLVNYIAFLLLRSD